MKLVYAVAAAMLWSSALAQDITLKLTPQEVAILGEALGEMKFKQAAPLVSKLQQQINEQLKPPEPAQAPEPPKQPAAKK